MACRINVLHVSNLLERLYEHKSHQRHVSAPWAPSSSRKMRIVGWSYGVLPADLLGVGAQMIVGNELSAGRV